MESWQVEQIRAHLPDLIRFTDCHVHLLSILEAKNILNTMDIEGIEAKTTKQEKAKLLYKTLLSRSNSYQVLTDALVETTQSGAASILRKFPWEKIANLQIKFLGNISPVKELLDNEQIQRVYQWLQENLNVEESSKINKNMLKSDTIVELVRNTIPEQDPLYIPRFLSRRIAINPTLFQRDCPDIFVFKNVDRLNLRPFVGLNGINLSTEQILSKKISSRYILLKRDKDWEKICAKLVTPVPIHLIRFEVATEEFVLEATSGGSDILNKHLQHRTSSAGEYLTEDEFVELSLSKSGSGFCICDSPGMGKSLLLANLARTMQSKNPEIFVCFIRLRDFNVSFTESSRQVILQHISTSALAFRLLQELTLNIPIKLALFFDGLDEVRTDELELTTAFLQKMFEEKLESKVFITARPVVRRELERVTKTIPYDIRPFNETTQLDFLTKVWKQKDTSGNLKFFQEYARLSMNKLQESLTEKEREISGVPLLCKMIADVFADEAIAYADGDLPKSYLKSFGRFKNTLLEVYANFVERQLGETKCSFECMSNNSTILNCLNTCKIRSFHVWTAIKLIFPDLAAKICKQINEFANLSTREILAPGLLLKTEESKLEFTHRTFAEYLVAEYFAKAIFTEHPSSFWRQHKFEEWATTEILATVNLHPDSDYELKNCTLRENVTAYFLNALIEENYQCLKILNTASLSVTSQSFLCSAVGCLRSDFHTILEMLLAKASDHEAYFRISQRNMLPDDTLVCLDVAGNCCKASTIKKFAMFYKEQYDIDLFERFATRRKYIEIFTNVLIRADYEVILQFINCIELPGHRFLFRCLENSYNADDELLNTRLDIASLLLSRCPELISESHHGFETWSPSAVGRFHLKAIHFLVERGAKIDAKNDFGQTLIHQAAMYMSLAEFQQTCETIFVGRTAYEMLLVFASPTKFLRNESFQGKNLNCRHSKLLTGVLHLTSQGVLMMCPEHLSQLWAMTMEQENHSHLNILSNILIQSEFCQKHEKTLINLYQIAVGEGDISVVDALLHFRPSLLEWEFNCSGSLRSSVPLREYQQIYRFHKGMYGTSVHEALCNEQLEMFQFLDSKSANIFAVDTNGNTILHKAASSGNCELFHRVLETVGRHWEKVPTSDDSLATSLRDLFNRKDTVFLQTPLHLACQWMNLPLATLDLYLTCGNMSASAETATMYNINEADETGQTLVMHSLNWRKLNLAQHLILRGAIVSETNKYGRTLLADILAYENFRLEETELALESGCYVNDLDHGNNVLQLAVAGNHPLSREFIEALKDDRVESHQMRTTFAQKLRGQTLMTPPSEMVLLKSLFFNNNDMKTCYEHYLKRKHKQSVVSGISICR